MTKLRKKGQSKGEKKTLEKSLKVPLYVQLEQVVRSKIQTGEFLPGEQIPTENELCRLYQVSSITARQAILNLTNEGLLKRIPGKGTFVTDKISETEILHARGGIYGVISSGLKEQAVKVMDITRVKPPKRVLETFNMEEGTEVVKVRRTRSAKKTPVSYIVNYLPPEIGKLIKKKDLQASPMLEVLSNKLGIELSSGNQSIEAIAADYDIALALSVNMSAPILYIETVIYSKQKKPIDFVQTYVRPDRYKYSIRLDLKKGPGNRIQVVRKEE
jgi:GntR family transcriptional regulator